jgi:thymidylate synthase (FAD)
MESIDEKSANGFVEMLTEIGHSSPTEHVSFTFGIEGVSRALLAQLTRHRIASFSVQSQRYVKEGCFEYVIPPQIEKNEDAKQEFLRAMESDRKSYETLVGILHKSAYEQNIKDGLDEKTANLNAEKTAIEDARFVLPNACETKLMLTMNARSLNNFFAHRCCNRAQWEIRALADSMLALCKSVSPQLFNNSGPHCLNAKCNEGKFSCGRIVEMRQKYKGNLNGG